mgnify:CR=1 FL=1
MKRALISDEVHITLHGKDDLPKVIDFISKFEVEHPVEVIIKRASKRAQGDQTATEYRAYCKLRFGVPILRRDSLEYRSKYDEIVRPMTYEHKLALMVEPFDFPVTSAMNVAQQSEFLDRIRDHFQELGFVLTDPSEWEV